MTANDRVTDNTKAFYESFRAMSPRQRRLRAQHQLRLANRQQHLSNILGGILLLLIIIICSFL